MSAIYQCETWKHRWWEGLPGGFWAKVNGKDWHGEQGVHIPDGAKYKVILYFKHARVAEAQFDVGSKTKVCLFIGRIRETHDGFEPGTFVIAWGTPPNCADVNALRELWKPRPNWVGDLYKHQPIVALRNVALPGTHDSATDEMTERSPYGIDNLWLEIYEKLSPPEQLIISAILRKRIFQMSLAQNHPVYIQLMNGIRYIDLRVENHSDWMTCHGMLADKLRDVVDQIGRFATEHPKEALLIHFQSLKGFNADQTQALVDYLLTHPTFGTQIASKKDFREDVTLDQLWEKGKNIICLFDTDEKVDLKSLWPADTYIESPWANTRHSEKVKSFLKENLPKRKDKGFYVSQAIVTPDATIFVFNLPMTLQKMATDWMNPELPGLVEKLDHTARDHKKSLNVVIADFYQSNGSFISTVIDVNRSNLVASGPVEIKNGDGHYLGFKNAHDPEVWGNASRAGHYEKLELICNGDGTYSLKNEDGNYLGFKAQHSPEVWGNATRIGGYEVFELIANNDGSHAVRNKDGNYLGFKKDHDPQLWGGAERVGGYERLIISTR